MSNDQGADEMLDTIPNKNWHYPDFWLRLVLVLAILVGMQTDQHASSHGPTTLEPDRAIIESGASVSLLRIIDNLVI